MKPAIKLNKNTVISEEKVLWFGKDCASGYLWNDPKKKKKYKIWAEMSKAETKGKNIRMTVLQ